jgi:hypothetical protein
LVFYFFFWQALSLVAFTVPFSVLWESFRIFLSGFSEAIEESTPFNGRIAGLIIVY